MSESGLVEETTLRFRYRFRLLGKTYLKQVTLKTLPLNYLRGIELVKVQLCMFLPLFVQATFIIFETISSPGVHHAR